LRNKTKLELHLFTRASKKKKWHPYKFHLIQKLSEDYFDKRVQFCDLIMEMINDDPLSLDNIIFFDEATFELKCK